MFKKKSVASGVAMIAAGLMAIGMAGCSQDAGGGSNADGGNAGATGPEWCGTEPTKVGYADGISGNSWRQISKAIFAQKAAECPNITEVIYTDANGDTQQAISDIDSLVAQGVNVLYVFPDAGQALLPAVKRATAAGVTVGINATLGAGEVGVDYAVNVDVDNFKLGQDYGTWMAEALGGEGNVMVIDGPAGNAQSQPLFDGVKDVFDEYPGLHLTPDNWVVGNWNQSDTQKAIAAQLAQGDLDGIITNVGDAALGAVQALQSAGHPLIPITTNEMNRVGCLFKELSPENPDFQLYAVYNDNKNAGLVLEQMMQSRAGLETFTETTWAPKDAFWDSLAGGDLAPACDTSFPMEAYMSVGLPAETFEEIFG